MKRLSLHFLFFILICDAAFSQDIPILFSVAQADYELLENPISLNEGEIWQPETNYSIFFNFEFEINGNIYTSLIVNAGIGLTFSGPNTPELWIWGSEWGGSPFLHDQGTDESESPIDYEITGSQGTHILKIQWQNAGIRGVEGEDDPDDFVNFQMWVYEGTDKVEVHYGSSQTSSISFGYNNGPGVRYFHIEDDWGICVHGYADVPLWDWVEFDGPYGGCLLDGVPSDGVVFKFYENPVVSISEVPGNKKTNFEVVYNKWSNELKVHIDEFENGKTYKLIIYDGRGMKTNELVLNNEDTNLKNLLLEKGLYIFMLQDQTTITTQKLILN